MRTLLDDRDRYLIIELFYHGKSERTLSLEIEVPPMTIHGQFADMFDCPINLREFMALNPWY